MARWHFASRFDPVVHLADPWWNVSRAALLASVLVGCAHAPAAAPALVALSEPAVVSRCASSASLTPTAGDARAALQAALSTGCLRLAAGRYVIDTPPLPRPVAMLVMPAGAELQGVGPETVLAFRGSASARDWRGIQLGDHAFIHGLTIDTSELNPGSTNEQTHAIRGDGPLLAPVITDLVINHPQRGATAGGDCIQIVGYPPSETAPDKRVYGLEVARVTFQSCDRSGVAVHSGLHGVLGPDGHWTARIHDSVFADVGDQDFDGEGSGDTDGLEIDNNRFLVGPHVQSALALQVQASTHVHIHDNRFEGRGVDLYGCSDCELDHDVITQTARTTDAALTVEKTSSRVSIHDETIERMVSAGDSNVVRIWQRGASRPDHVTIADSRIVQHAAASPLSTSGVVGFQLTRSAIVYDSIGLTYIGADLLGSSGYYAMRTTELSIESVMFTGPLAAAVRISGSYGGVGTLTLERVRATGARQGLRCENVTTGAGVLGPVTYTDNTLPAPVCGALVRP